MNSVNSAAAEAIITEAPWVDVCELTDLAPNTGICALINQQQIALLYSSRLDEVFAIGNYDPIGKANVLSRGIIGSIGDAVVVASPLYKQHFDLRTGECLESPEHKVNVYPVQVIDGKVQVQI
ncbi:nitrite reductase small subunit NirD [Marinimicrobium sp. ABcell2]|uniref:nitrite reductase small subunit NirD n=1 Tax=Marinimicrobium sp. ABcell2 TaxID=3069751 RepID=UPI0027B2D026|nr:nitrite reductase small subunit NirD [Marinimicrobium sp. ABcell2]MDQ2076069.1 nitrite reductase small subunit NirD [Marinimicrobium sp. ABcell2]